MGDRKVRVTWLCGPGEGWEMGYGRSGGESVISDVDRRGTGGGSGRDDRRGGARERSLVLMVIGWIDWVDNSLIDYTLQVWSRGYESYRMISLPCRGCSWLRLRGASQSRFYKARAPCSRLIAIANSWLRFVGLAEITVPH